MISLVQLLQRQNTLCVARIYKHAHVHLAIVKRMKYVRILGVAKWGGALTTIAAERQLVTAQSSISLDRSYELHR